jgi:hypothetical protein
MEYKDFLEELEFQSSCNGLKVYFMEKFRGIDYMLYNINRLQQDEREQTFALLIMYLFEKSNISTEAKQYVLGKLKFK